MKRKRWRFEADDKKTKNWGQLEKVVSEIVENEKLNLREELCEQYKETYREFYRDHNELKKLNQALQYKADCFEKMYNKIMETRDEEINSLAPLSIYFLQALLIPLSLKEPLGCKQSILSQTLELTI